MSNDYELIELVNNDEIEIRYVYHLADIHIRNQFMREQYEIIFTKTYDKILSESEGKRHESIIVLAGDIVHSKCDLSPEAIDMTYHFLNSLSQILPVIVIPGNHDMVLSNRDRMDALTPIIKNSELGNIFYLKSTNFYRYHNIIFGLTNMFASTPLLAENITPEMLEQITQQNKYKIALYHGPIQGSKTDLGFEIKSKKFRGKDFRNYDFGFFGDQHIG